MCPMCASYWKCIAALRWDLPTYVCGLLGRGEGMRTCALRRCLGLAGLGGRY